MFSTISWPQYFLFLLVATIIYYLLVWIIFFKALLPDMNKFRLATRFQQPGEDQPDELLHTTQHIIDEIRPLFKGRNNKNELLLALQLHLKKYSAWNEPGFRELLHAFINQESQTICSIQFSEEELRLLWL